jgi:hypothetical protein
MMTGEGPRSAWPLRIVPNPSTSAAVCPQVSDGGKHVDMLVGVIHRTHPQASIAHWRASHSKKKASSPRESQSGDPSPSDAPRTSGPRHSVIKRAHLNENRDFGVKLSLPLASISTAKRSARQVER